MKRLLLPAVSTLLLAGGCYGYYPETTATPVGRDVQVTLTDSGSVVLAPRIGPQVQSLLGRLDADSSRNLLVALSSVKRRDGDETTWKGERVAVPRALVATVEERRFSRARTTLFSGALAVALVAIREGFAGRGGSTGGSGLPTTGTRQ